MFHALTIDFNPKYHTIGQLVESLLFYDELHVIVSLEGIMHLWRTIGIDMLEHLQTYGLRLHIAMNTISCGNIPGFGEDVRYFILQSQNMHDRVIEKSLKEFYNVPTLEADQIRWMTYYVDNSTEFTYSDVALDGLHNDIYHGDVHKRFVQAQLDELDITHTLFDSRNKYEFRETSKGFVFNTNLPLGDIEQMAQQNGHEDFAIKHANLLIEMTKTYGLMSYAAELNSTLCTTPCQSLIVSCKQVDLLNKYNAEQNEIKTFERVNAMQCHGVANVVDAGEKSWSEIYQLLDAAQAFKQWKSSLPTDADFVREFMVAMEENKPWVKRAPVKVIRWIVTSILGSIPIAGMALGPIASGFDNFLIDKWQTGAWIPGQFVVGPLKKFQV